MAAESKIERYLRAEVAKLGGWCQKMTSPGVRACPDNLVMWSVMTYKGTALFWDNWQYVEFIETKAPNGKLSVLQQRDHKRRREMGFQVHVIWNMEQAETYLKSRGKQ